MGNPLPYQACTTCVMDTSDSSITFDASGRCVYCNNFHSTIKPSWHTDEQGERDDEHRGVEPRAAGLPDRNATAAPVLEKEFFERE